jgi:hypothetical protein
LEEVTKNWKDETLQIVDEMYGEKWPRGLTLRILIDHEIHHRGQMTVLMRQAGLKVPGIMGPSRENGLIWNETAGNLIPSNLISELRYRVGAKHGLVEKPLLLESPCVRFNLIHYNP